MDGNSTGAKILGASTGAEPSLTAIFFDLDARKA